MTFAIRYSLRAKIEQIELLDYILQKFGQKKAKEVFDKIEKTLNLISNAPEMFPESKRKMGLRKCVFSKQTSIYYRINRDYIEVVSFRSNRVDPGKFTI